MESPSRVLIVDNDRQTRAVLRAALEAEQVLVTEASDGAEALGLIPVARPEVMVLDLTLPYVDGYAVLDTLRAEDWLSRVQVVIYTRAGKEALRSALERGASDFVRKSDDVEEVVARVKAQLRFARSARLLEQRRHDGELLAQIGGRLSSRLDIQSILQDVTTMMATLLATDRCSVVLVDGDDPHRGRVVAASDDLKLTDLAVDLRAYPEIRRAIETREPLVVRDARVDPLLAEVQPRLATLEVRASALFPLLERDRCIGVLFVRATRPEVPPLGERELQLGRIVASATAAAISNARLFANLKEETDRVSHARAVIEQRLQAVQRYADFFESAADATFICGPSARVLFLNRKAEEIAEAGSERAAGRPLADVLHLSDASAITDLFEAVRLGDFSLRLDLNGPGGRILSASAARIPGDSAVSLTVRDVTDERRNEKLAALAELAGAAAHELNQPLTSVLGYAELLELRLVGDATCMKAVRMIREQSERMATIVRRIGRITRYETKGYAGHTRIIDLEQAADASVDMGIADADSVNGLFDDLDDDAADTLGPDGLPPERAERNSVAPRPADRGTSPPPDPRRRR
jgi:DNA-binding response OmpR family regulator